MERSVRTSVHENRQKPNAKILQIPTSLIGRLRKTIPPESIRLRLPRCRPPTTPPFGTSGFSAAGKAARATPQCQTPRCQTPRRHVCPGTSCGRNVIKWPASVREERVLCKSILSPQREPMDESIIRRVKSPMLPKFRCYFRQILPVGKKFPKSFPSSRPRSLGLAGRPLGVLLAVATFLGHGIWPISPRQLGVASERF